jgi:hypothetical protein
MHGFERLVVFIVEFLEILGLFTFEILGDLVCIFEMIGSILFLIFLEILGLFSFEYFERSGQLVLNF